MSLIKGQMRLAWAVVKAGVAAIVGGSAASWRLPLQAERFTSLIMSTAHRPTVTLSPVRLAAEAWALAFGAARPSLVWIGVLALVTGLYRSVLTSGVGAGIAGPLLLLAAFLVGVQLSLAAYRAMLGTQGGRFPHLIQANLAVYLAFLFLSVFVGFFLAILPGILLEASGRDDLGPDTSAEVWQAAISDMLPTAYGAVLMGVIGVGALIMAFFALRLLLIGAATVARQQTLVFRTWRKTEGHALRLGGAALVTHIVPFILGVGAATLTDQALGTTGVGGFIGGALGVLYLMPFVLAGHGLAVAALGALDPGALSAGDDEIAPAA